MTANALRGEAALSLAGRTFRFLPSFTALVAAETELGPLFALVERAAAGQLRLDELAALLWHCLDDRSGLDRLAFADAIVAAGLATATPVLRILLAQVLQGR